jgi:hypothetical protein
VERPAAPAIELRPWADLVFHVLSHAFETASFAASLCDRVYVEFAARHLGPASERSLEEDAAVLGRVLESHERLARVQLVARLFTSVEAAARHAAIDLADLARRGVVQADLVQALEPIIEAAELLRVACELEREAFLKLPESSFDSSALVSVLAEASAVAPALARCIVAAVRSLRLRGRAFPEEIWIGLPSIELGVSLDHVAWQACHEATVLELQAAADPVIGERAVEHAALVLLAERALAAGKQPEHRRWLAHFGKNALPLDRDALPDQARLLLESVRPRA